MRESWQVDNISKILCSLQNFHPVNNSLSGLNYVTSQRFLLPVKQMAFSLSKYRKIEGPDHKHRSSPKIYLSLAKVLFQSFLFGKWVLLLQDLRGHGGEAQREVHGVPPVEPVFHGKAEEGRHEHGGHPRQDDQHHGVEGHAPGRIQGCVRENYYMIWSELEVLT